MSYSTCTVIIFVVLMIHSWIMQYPIEQDGWIIASLKRLGVAIFLPLIGIAMGVVFFK